MLSSIWGVVKSSVVAFFEDDAQTRGAAIAFYAITSAGPLLLIIVAVAGLVFGEDAASGAIQAQASAMMGDAGAKVLQAVIASAARQRLGLIATIIGGVGLLLSASGIFGQVSASLNAIWRVEPRGGSVRRLLRVRLVSLVLTVLLGGLLMVSLAISAVVSALSGSVDQLLPFGGRLLEGVNFAVSLALMAATFAALYKILPDRSLEWRDVIIGAVVTSLLFTVGKSLIGVYIGSSNMATSYGAAGGLLIVMIWIYYSAQIFLLGAEFTRAYATRFGSLAGRGEKLPAEGSRVG